MFHALPSHGEGENVWDGCGKRGTVQLVDLEEGVGTRHPLRKISRVVAGRVPEFPALYPDFARPSITPERLIRASMIQLLVSARSEWQVTAQAQYDIFLAMPPGDGLGSRARPESLPKIGPIHRWTVETHGTRAMPRRSLTANGSICGGGTFPWIAVAPQLRLGIDCGWNGPITG